MRNTTIEGATNQLSQTRQQGAPMNTFVQKEYWIVEMTEALTMQLLDLLSDDTLGHTAAAHNPSLGDLFAGQAAIQTAYIESFRTFTGDFHNIAPVSIDSGSVDALRQEFRLLHAGLKTELGTLSDEDFASRKIDRDGGFQIPLTVQVHIYRESILIFCGKVSVYLRSLGIAFPEQWVNWIG
jgi:hypothetical protein